MASGRRPSRVIIHEYFRVVRERVWTVIDKDLPLLKKVVTEKLND